MSSNNFNSYGHYYDILNSDKNYHKEVKYIQKIISLFLKKKKKTKDFRIRIWYWHTWKFTRKIWA